MESLDIGLIAKHWHKRTGYFAVLVPILLAEVAAFASNLVILAGVAVFTVAALEVAWRLSRALPKTKRGKLGFVISLACDDEQQAKRIRADFVQTLRRLLKAGRSGPTFQVIDVPQVHAEEISDIDDAQRLRLETRAQFVLYGRVRFRQFSGKDHHFVELDGIVAHQPIPDEVSKVLAREFSELLPRKLAIAAENDLFAFEFTSQWAEMVARYVIGIAAALSGDFDYAEQLYKDVLVTVEGARRDFAIFNKLRERLPRRLNEIHEARAIVAYQRWVDKHEAAAVDEMGVHLSRINTETYLTPSVINLSALHAFLADRDVTRALDWLRKVDGQARNATWHLNVAFLLAYEEDLRTAIREYRRAVEQEAVEVDLIAKIEDFVYYIATAEPDKYQLFYCLGFFNWKFKGDTAQAIKDFKTFLERRDAEKFAPEAELATRWLKQIEAMPPRDHARPPHRTRDAQRPS